MINYNYTIEGKDANNQTWTITGTVEVETRGLFPTVPDIALRKGFALLTQGKAKYGSPGVGCKGPYSITKLIVEEVTE